MQPNKSCTEKKNTNANANTNTKFKYANANANMQMKVYNYTSQVQWSQLEVVEKLSNFLTQMCFLPLEQNEYNYYDFDDDRQSGVSFSFLIELNPFTVSI